jgi:hypothetical protein
MKWVWPNLFQINFVKSPYLDCLNLKHSPPQYIYPMDHTVGAAVSSLSDDSGFQASPGDHLSTVGASCP